MVTMAENEYPTVRIDMSAQWAKVNWRLVGEVVFIGGEKVPRIHLLTKRHGELAIGADKKLLAEEASNYLYKDVLATVSAEENSETGELRNLWLLWWERCHEAGVEHHE